MSFREVPVQQEIRQAQRVFFWSTWPYPYAIFLGSFLIQAFSSASEASHNFLIEVFCGRTPSPPHLFVFAFQKLVSLGWAGKSSAFEDAIDLPCQVWLSAAGSLQECKGKQRLLGKTCCHPTIDNWLAPLSPWMCLHDETAGLLCWLQGCQPKGQLSPRQVGVSYFQFLEEDLENDATSWSGADGYMDTATSASDSPFVWDHHSSSHPWLSSNSLDIWAPSCCSLSGIFVLPSACLVWSKQLCRVSRTHSSLHEGPHSTKWPSEGHSMKSKGVPTAYLHWKSHATLHWVSARASLV